MTQGTDDITRAIAWRADAIRVNTWRMQAARVAAGLTPRQVMACFDLDVRPGEYFGMMQADALERLRDLYGVRPGWLQEEGPIGDPASPWTLIEAVSC
jgi:hypothetical protein